MQQLSVLDFVLQISPKLWDEIWYKSLRLVGRKENGKTVKMAKLYNELTLIMGHAFSFNFMWCNFIVSCQAYFSHVRRAKNYCTAQEQECHKFVMPRPDWGEIWTWSNLPVLQVDMHICMYQCQWLPVQDKNLIGCIPQSINLISLTVCVYLHPSVGCGGGEVGV